MKKAIVFLANGFEEMEATGTVDVLCRGGVEVKTVSISSEREVTGAHGMVYLADATFGDMDFSEADALILPGGMPGTINMCNHYDFNTKLKEYNERGGLIAAICAAPMVLGKAGILGGRRATIYDGMEAELLNAEYTGEDVTVCENIVTGRGPGLAMDFALKLIELVKGREKMEEVKAGLLYEKEL